MADRSKIEWTDASLNPVLAEDLATGKLGYHCVKVSPECANCYAETHNRRNLPARGTGRRYTKAHGREVRIVLHRPALEKLLAWRRPRLVFVCSMTDLFGEFVPTEIAQEVLDACDLAARERGHVCQVLTKRPERMLEETRRWTERTGRPLPWGVWLGVSAGDQRRADERIPVLLECEAGVRFVSYEPAIGPVDFRLEVDHRGHRRDYIDGTPWPQCLDCSTEERSVDWTYTAEPRIHWIIPGGESGAGARPLDVAWILAAVAAGERAGVPVFVKQLGAKPYEVHGRHGHRRSIRLRHHKGGDPAEWPDRRLAVRAFPSPPADSPWSWLESRP